MTASGPFAMGPTLAGSSIRRSAPLSNFTTTAPVSGTSLKNDVGNTDDIVKNGLVKTEDGEYYSDPDEGVEIIDMEDVHRLDWMAPDSIRKERQKVHKEAQKKKANMETVKSFRRLELHCVEVSALGR